MNYNGTEAPPHRIVTSNNDCIRLQERVKEGVASTEEIEAEDDSSVLYTVILDVLFIAAPFAGAKRELDVEKVCEELPVHVSRLCGAVVCLAEVIIEAFPMTYVGRSLAKDLSRSFGGPHQEILFPYLIKEYHHLFGRSLHFFVRKIGGAPLQNLEMWPRSHNIATDDSDNNIINESQITNIHDKGNDAAPLSLTEYLNGDDDDDDDDDKLLTHSGELETGYIPSMTSFSPPPPAGAVQLPVYPDELEDDSMVLMRVRSV